MVLQRDEVVPVWGTADTGERVTVQFAGQIQTATADSSKHWKILLDPMPASSQSRVLQVSTVEFKVSFADVLVGEVWLCSGQSNMHWPMEGWEKTEATEKAIAEADWPGIRLFRTPSRFLPFAQESANLNQYPV